MRKTTIFVGSLLVIAMLVAPGMASAKVTRVSGVWDLIGSYVLDFVCATSCAGTFSHQMDITTQDEATGDVTGSGFYLLNPAYTWDLAGKLVGSAFDFVITYTGLNAGCTVEATSIIADDGTISGTAESSSGQTFTFTTASGSADQFDGNHGQYVREQENKREAAQSRVGMPEQSKGHTK